MTVTQATRGTGEKPSAQLAVSTNGLTKRFGDRTVVDRVDLAIPAGSVCGFVGPNGAGKTTTIRMLLGLIRPTAGGGSILGGSLAEPPTYLRKVGALIEAPAFYPQLSGQDNLRALARLGQLNLKTVAPALARAGLTARAGDKYRSYSLGMKQRLGIAAALLPDPELLILDEPTNGLDPAGIVEMRGLIRSFADDGMTVLVSSHLISEIEQICDYVVMIRAGGSSTRAAWRTSGRRSKEMSSPLPSTTRTSSSWPRSLRPLAARQPCSPRNTPSASRRRASAPRT